MNLSFHDWQDGYTAGSCMIHALLKRVGWARAKGNVKRSLKATILFPPESECGRGLCDAYLDSVGC